MPKLVAAGVDVTTKPFWEDLPDIPESLDGIVRAFWELSTCRPVGTSLGAISFLAIDRYATRYNLDDFDEFLALIRAMDTAFLKFNRTR